MSWCHFNEALKTNEVKIFEHLKKPTLDLNLLGSYAEQNNSTTLLIFKQQKTVFLSEKERK